jgi:hypothetical protein
MPVLPRSVAVSRATAVHKYKITSRAPVAYRVGWIAFTTAMMMSESFTRHGFCGGLR